MFQFRYSRKVACPRFSIPGLWAAYQVGNVLGGAIPHRLVRYEDRGSGRVVAHHTQHVCFIIKEREGQRFEGHVRGVEG